MRSLRILMLSLTIFSGGALFAQEDNVKKKFERKGDLIEATFYHDNGEVAQKGFYKNGELHGEWIAYDIKGNKTAIGKYLEGEKIGKWFFWNGDMLSEVDFNERRITSVTHWKNKSRLVNN